MTQWLPTFFVPGNHTEGAVCVTFYVCVLVFMTLAHEYTAPWTPEAQTYKFKEGDI